MITVSNYVPVSVELPKRLERRLVNMTVALLLKQEAERTLKLANRYRRRARLPRFEIVEEA